MEQVDANGCTDLHWACMSGSYDAVRYLVALGANVNAISFSDGSTPIH